MLKKVIAGVKSPNPKRDVIRVNSCLLQKKWTTITHIERQ